MLAGDIRLYKLNMRRRLLIFDGLLLVERIPLAAEGCESFDRLTRSILVATSFAGLIHRCDILMRAAHRRRLVSLSRNQCNTQSLGANTLFMLV